MQADLWIHSLRQEDALEKGMATHSSIIAWRIPWTEEPGGSYPVGKMGLKLRKDVWAGNENSNDQSINCK